MSNKRKHGVAELRAAGEALYGNQWQTDLSRALGLSDARRLRQWLHGDRPIPAGVWADICSLLRERGQCINDVLQHLAAE